MSPLTEEYIIYSPISHYF